MALKFACALQLIGNLRNVQPPKGYIELPLTRLSVCLSSRLEAIRPQSKETV